jgi:alkaline phosphatase D
LIAPRKSLAATPVAKLSSDPFMLGVASGDPLSDSVVLWTRLAPDPTNGGGMPSTNVTVEWEVASDDRMKKIVRRGKEVATPEWGHSVHAEVGGLDPARWYWYRFRAGEFVTPVARTRTAPASGARPSRVSFAFASCQHYEAGYFTAYKHMADEDIDFVIHLGDYIYEGAAIKGRVRMHNGPEIASLADYRNRYALYKSDPDLKHAHASFPWMVTWDDHEVDNNYAGDTSEDNAPKEPFLARRAAAYQAYYEHMPLRRASMPRGPDMKLYRGWRYGQTAEFHMLDTRQYRTDQPCGDGMKDCPEARAPEATIMGREQERWLLDRLAKTSARWNVLAQQVMLAPLDTAAGPERRHSMDKWGGYLAERDRLLNFLAERRVSNPVVLTGDIHSNWVADLKRDPDDTRSATVGAEFVGTSISSGGDGSDSRPEAERLLSENPHIKFYNGQRGYVRCELTARQMTADYRIISSVTKPGGQMSTRARFVVESGKPGAQRG